MNLVLGLRTLAARIVTLFTHRNSSKRPSASRTSLRACVTGRPNGSSRDAFARVMEAADCWDPDVLHALTVAKRLRISLAELLSFRSILVPETGQPALVWLNPPRELQAIFDDRRASLDLGDNDFLFGSGKPTDVRRFQRKLQEMRVIAHVERFSWKDLTRIPQ